MTDPELVAELQQREMTRWHIEALSFCRRRLETSAMYWSERHPRWRECENLYRAFRIPDQTDEQTRDDTRTEGVEKVVVPYAYAIIETMRSFCMDVIKQRKPLIPVEAPGGSQVLQAMLMEQCLATQADRMPMPLLLVIHQNLLDAFRYGVGVTKVLWGVDEMPTVTRRQNPVVDPTTGNVVSFQEEVQEHDVARYEGNICVPVSPFDFFPDHRRSLGEFQKGEYVGQRFVKSWTELRQAQAQGLYAGVEWIPRGRTEAQYGGSPYGLGGPQDSNLARIMDMSNLRGGAIDERSRDYADIHELWVYVTDIHDLEWRADLQDPPDTRPPRLWVFTIANMARILRVEQALLPGLRFPYEIFEPNYDVHSPANHSVIEVMRGLQYFYSWLFNSRMTAVRRTLNNELIYDPDIIEERDILDPEPGRMIRVKREHRGEGRAKDAVWPIPVQDSTAGHLGDAEAVRGMIQEILGIPSMLMGMQSTGRRPATEMQAIMKSATGRLGVLMSIWETQFGQPLAAQMAKNTQMFLDLSQPLALKEPYKSAIGMPFIQVRPDMLMGDFTFPFLEVGLPTDKGQEAAIFKEFLMQGMQANPQLLQMFPWQLIITRWLRAMNIKDYQSFQVNAGMLSVMAPPEQPMPPAAQAGGPNPFQPGPSPMQAPLGAIRQQANAQGTFPTPDYEGIPNVGPNGLGRA